MRELIDTTAAGIAAEMLAERERHGSPAMGMVMTMVIVVDEDAADDALTAARHASHEHPARVLGVILGSGRGKAQVNAQVGIGSGWTGETALIRLSGPVVKHCDSVVSPLLLPDSPVVVWWPRDHPEDPGTDPIGLLANRRITDAAEARTHPTSAMRRLHSTYAPGTTDLAWTRLTPWRALLAAALDQHPVRVRGGSVTAERVSPSADLLVAWLAQRLKVPISRSTSEGPGITCVELETAGGPIRISRRDGRLATFSSPGRPDRPIALKRRSVDELLAEELRRLDEDDVYAATVKYLQRNSGSKSKKSKTSKTPRKSGVTKR